MRFLPAQTTLRVAVVGLGYVGIPLAATLAERGAEVVGVDINADLIAELSQGRCRMREPGLEDLVSAQVAAGRLRVTGDCAAVAGCDVVLVTVGTPIRDDGSLAGDQLQQACLELGRHLRAGQLVALKSTVPPGTTRELVLPLLERGGLAGEIDFGLAFVPERLAQGSALRDLRTLPVVVGGLGTGSAASVAAFWRRAMGVDVVVVESLEAAEIVKLASNWWIDLNIALANELAMFSELFDVDVLDVIAAANTIPKGNGKVNILLPSVGVGGSCLTKDPWMVAHTARRRGLEIRTVPAGRGVNDGMPRYTAQLVIDELRRLGKDPASATVAVLGLAYKNDTGDLRATPVVPAVAALAASGATVRLYDPLADPIEVKAAFGIAPAPSLVNAVADADCLAILALHKEFADLDFAALPVAKQCVIVDGRAHYPKEKVALLDELGYVYRGIGR
ncbi:nucleotide sugar dehydrogenase [Allorhizocola rhizosphaerae]|uniref:nucleotide sugar dehydrogenase n=1 Tax=Allorhizocola rhizosphaerae TaxID=1872709 RepID=UPI000E3D7FA7|nr:nucleotide sugar dehydrogenase [Allorhizocola rhizosphaerae]